MSRWSWRAHACLGVVLIAAYFLVPSVAAQDILYSAVGAFAVAAMAIGVSAHRPRARVPWLLLMGGQALFVAGDVLWDIFADVLHNTPFPSVADVLYLAAYPLLAAGLYLLVRDRDPHRDRASLIDALIVSVDLAVVAWVFWMGRYADDPSLSAPQFAISMAYPIMDLLLIGFLARLTLSRGSRPLSYRLLSASLFLTLVSDVAFAGLEFTGSYFGRNLIDVGWLLAYVAIGAAALHPSMRSLSEPPDVPLAWSNRRRLALLAGASLLIPGVFGLRALLGRPVDVAALVLGPATIFLLVLARMAGLITQVERDAEQLRGQGTRLSRALEKEHEVVAELQELNRLKGNFVAMVSHELRTPLTAIIGYAKTLRLRQIDEDPQLRAESLQVMERQGERLLRLVENLLTASQLENRAVPFSISAIRVEDLFREVVEGQSGASGDRVHLSLPADPLIVHGDRQLLARVLTNLVDNALKYSPSASPCELGAEALHQQVRFWVRDRGIGIAPEEMERIFDRFYQVDSSPTRSYTGVGLGLSLVRDILRDLGGAVEVTSEPGKGSTFVVTLPVRYRGFSEPAEGDPSLLTAS
jgi:signal transduction histidine kinase